MVFKKIDSIEYKLHKVQQGFLHYCIIEIDLYKSKGKHTISYELNLFENTSEPNLVTECTLGVRMFFKKHQFQAGDDQYHIHITALKTTYVDSYPGDGVLVAYLALFQRFFPQQAMPDFTYNRKEWMIRLNSEDGFTTAACFCNDVP